MEQATPEQQRYAVEGNDVYIDLGPGGVEAPEGIYEAERYSINMGPQHPATHGVLRLRLEMDGETVIAIDPVIGYLHRCFEKHAEALTYSMVIPFTDRLDYLAGMNQNWSLALGVERMAGIEVPEKVEYIRVIVGELNRVASHLVAFGTFGLDMGAFTPFLWSFRDREKILDLLEWASGARLLYNYIWVGGVARDLPDGWTKKCLEFLDYFEPKISDYNNLLTDNQIFIERTAKSGIISEKIAVDYGLTGPNLRGSGVNWDLRRDDPYSIYDRFEWDVALGTGQHGPLGSCWDRYWVRIQEMSQSIRILRQAIKDLPAEGDVHEKVPKKAKVPESDYYVRTEAPKGELGFYIIGGGKDTAKRIKARSPSFCAISAMDAVVKSPDNPRMLIADVVATIASFDIVLGEIDR